VSSTDHYPSTAERLADLWVHAIGLGAAAVGAIGLIAMSALSGSAGQTIAISIYGTGLVLMLLSSTAYNLARSAVRRRRLRRFDHAAIFVLIACSYTPFTTQRLEGSWALWMTAAVWTTAAIGIAIKLVVNDPPRGLSLAAYLASGWLAVVAIKPFIEQVPIAALWLLGLGGIVYSVGAAIYALDQIRFRRAIWHGFVIVAAALHWIAVLVGVVRPGPLAS